MCLYTKLMCLWALTLKSIVVIYWPRPMHLWSLKVKGPMRCRDLDQNPFLPIRSMWSWPLTLDPKIHFGHLLTKSNAFVKFEDQLSMLIRNCFGIHSQCDPSFWPSDPKINRGHLLAKANAHMQFEGQCPMGCHVIDRKPFLPTRSIRPWSLTLDPKIERGHLLANTIAPMRFKG
jgi:hypothetical protein